jgi:hypothetical protein
MKNYMEMKLLIDTWGWLTLRDKREKRHDDVNAFFLNFLNLHGIIYTLMLIVKGKINIRSLSP